MNEKAFPTEIPASRPQASRPPRHRNCFCPHYASCLDVAIERGWLDWTCSLCPLFQETPTPSAGQWAHDRRNRE